MPVFALRTQGPGKGPSALDAASGQAEAEGDEYGEEPTHAPPPVAPEVIGAELELCQTLGGMDAVDSPE